MATAAEPQAEKRVSTAPFKVVPETRELRDRVRAEAAPRAAVATAIDVSALRSHAIPRYAAKLRPHYSWIGRA